MIGPYFTVQYYSYFHGEWCDWTPITFNSQPMAYATEREAKAALLHAQRQHPRDAFRITESKDA